VLTLSGDNLFADICGAGFLNIFRQHNPFCMHYLNAVTTRNYRKQSKTVKGGLKPLNNHLYNI